MLFRVYASPPLKERMGRCWLKKEIEEYLDHLAALGYRACFVLRAADLLLSFGEYVARHAGPVLDRLPVSMGRFARQLHREGELVPTDATLVSRFVRHVFREPARELARSVYLRADLVEDYARWIREQKGLSPGSVYNARRLCDRFLESLAEGERVCLKAISAESVLDFVVAEGKRYSRVALASHCGDLRGFLRYLHRRGLVAADYAPVVPSPRVFRHEACPRFLTRPEVEAVLGAIDRTTARGRRDYAMLVLLATYGLRGGEVARLRLDDIDWRKHMLHIRRRKAGNDTAYPLSVPIGEAILSYLRYGRPPTTHREVFLSSVPPFHPFPDSAALCYLACLYLRKAAIQVAHPGTHTFRYSCAQRLFEQGMPLKSISDYLGHRNLDSTQRYTKMALDQLREVALGDGEDLL